MNYRFVKKENLTYKEAVIKMQLEGKDPSVLSDLTEVDYQQDALQRFAFALKELKGHRVFIVGDYDCDGITSTFIIRRLLKRLQVECNYYIPNRFTDGYGLSERMVEVAKTHGFDTILCLDNGVSALSALQKAKLLGLDVLILDHHEYDQAPDVKAFLHPKLLNEVYRDCCTAGLSTLLTGCFEEDDLVSVYGCLGTLADMVSVFGYNRYLLKKGLELLNRMPVAPIDSLSGKSMDYTFKDLSYLVIPKINACSRLQGKANVNMLVSFLDSDGKETTAAALQIEEINQLRKEISMRMEKDALLNIHKSPILFSYSDSYEEGLCGIVAGRLSHAYHRPSLVFSEKNGILKGSGRSVPGYNLYGALANYRTHFTSFGGHEGAVGLSLPLADKDDFLSYLNRLEVHEQPQKDCLVLEGYDENLLNDLHDLEPFGTGFQKPLFAIVNPQIKNKFMIKGLYPKYTLENQMEAICFNSSLTSETFTAMIGSLDEKPYRKGVLSLIIEDLI